MNDKPGGRDGGTNAPAGWRGSQSFHVARRDCPEERIDSHGDEETFP
jgi:hypothetical protein